MTLPYKNAKYQEHSYYRDGIQVARRVFNLKNKNYHGTGRPGKLVDACETSLLLRGHWGSIKMSGHLTCCLMCVVVEESRHRRCGTSVHLSSGSSSGSRLLGSAAAESESFINCEGPATQCSSRRFSSETAFMPQGLWGLRLAIGSA